MLSEKIKKIADRLDTRRINYLNELERDLKDKRLSEVFKNEQKLNIPKEYITWVEKANEEKDAVIENFVQKNRILKTGTAIVKLNNLTQLFRSSKMSDDELHTLIGEHRKDLMFMELLEKGIKINVAEYPKTLSCLILMQLINDQVENIERRKGEYFSKDLNMPVTTHYTVANDLGSIYDKSEETISICLEKLEKKDYDISNITVW